MEGHLASSLSINNKKQTYQTLLTKIKKMIISIKEMEIDTSQYEAMLKEINDEVLQKGIKNNSYNKLNNIYQLLKPYEVYYEAIYNCRYVLLKINCDNTLEEIKYYANLVIASIKNVKKNEGLDHQFEEKLLKEIYDIAYQVIKVELIITGESCIYNYILNNQIDIYFFDEIIRNDLMKINCHNSVNIQEKIYDIKRQGIDASFFDLELIKMLIAYSDKKTIDKINLKFDSLSDEIIKNGDELDLTSSSVEQLKEEITDETIRTSRYRKSIRVKIISLFLALNLIIGGGYLTVRIAKNSSSKHVFNKIVTEYDQSTDKLYSYEYEETFNNKNNADNYTLVEVYEPGEYCENCKEFHGNVMRYVFDEITLDSIYDYLTYDVSKADFQKESRPYNYSIDETSKYSQGYRFIEQVSYEDLEREEVEYLGSNIIMGLFIYLMIIAFIDGIIYAIRYDFNNLKGEPFFSTLISLIDDFNSVKDSKGNMYEVASKMNEKMVLLLDIIKKDDELRSQFERQLEANKYLLYNPEELMKKVNNIELMKVKDKAKKLAKDRNLM